VLAGYLDVRKNGGVAHGDRHGGSHSEKGKEPKHERFWIHDWQVYSVRVSVAGGVAAVILER
jgi:hypothetical protein